MSNLIPQEMNPDEVAALLREMAELVEMGDSYEGFIEYALPDLPEWAQRGEPKPEGWVERDYRLVRGVYRIGNREGQGGSRMIGTVPGAEIENVVTEAKGD